MCIATYISCALIKLVKLSWRCFVTTLSVIPTDRSVIEERQLTLPDNLLPAASIGFLAGLFGYFWEGKVNMRI